MANIALAYRNLASEFRFSFFLAETAIQCEAPFQSGTVNVTNGSTAVTLTLGSDSLSWNPAWVNRRIVISGRGESYVVQSIGGVTALTLASPWAGDTDITGDLAYVMYRAVYPMPIDCDYGMDIMFWDAQRNIPFPMISAYDMKLSEAYAQGQVGTPGAVARVQIQSDVNGNPLEMVEFGPQAPGSAFVYPAFYFKKPPAPTLGGYPLWPENYEDLIPRRAEIELEQNPRHRIALHPEAKQQYHRRLFDLKKRSDGGAEISRRIQRYSGDAWASFFRNVNFTATGVNPLTGA